MPFFLIFNNYSKIMFLIIMMIGTLISISANSWLSAWMGLEINLLTFIPLMKTNKLMSSESSFKYFLIQALASAVFLYSIILLMLNMEMIIFNYLLKMMTFSSLIMKMGSAPFHFWLPMVMEGLTWMNVLILMTWQKIAPMMLISYIIMKPMMITSIILSSIIGALGGLNQTSLRKLMAYSSINHLSWMLMALYNSNMLMIMYLSFYTFMSFTLLFMFNIYKISYINQMNLLFFNKKPMKILMLLNLLSMGGLPPFLGFFPKWMIIQLLTINNQLFFMIIMIFMSLITLYFYLRLCYSIFMLNYYENNWIMDLPYYSSSMITFISCSLFSVTGLFTVYSLYFLF